MKLKLRSFSTAASLMTVAFCCLHSANSQSGHNHASQRNKYFGEVRSYRYHVKTELKTQSVLMAIPQVGGLSVAASLPASNHQPDEGFQTRLPAHPRIAAADDLPLFDSFPVPESVPSAIQIQGLNDRLTLLEDNMNAPNETVPVEVPAPVDHFGKPVTLRHGRTILNLPINRSGWRSASSAAAGMTHHRPLTNRSLGDDIPTPPATTQSAGSKRETPIDDDFPMTRVPPEPASFEVLPALPE